MALFFAYFIDRDAKATKGSWCTPRISAPSPTRFRFGGGLLTRRILVNFVLI
ncbi:hypothetical protein [Argonema antarcticum]|uniref:hypothetical protein n=1 Tax=Argonema antarcticum TaxID=2942763 RepID=UPI00201307FD|nr:hypothetical protein [Argonema antarcticum]MCL1472847.1 hypothetical protein [Argonema antarcticum A004/B2]